MTKRIALKIERKINKYTEKILKLQSQLLVLQMERDRIARLCYQSNWTFDPTPQGQVRARKLLLPPKT